jgi:hypothetical protein
MGMIAPDPRISNDQITWKHYAHDGAQSLADITVFALEFNCPACAPRLPQTTNFHSNYEQVETRPLSHNHCTSTASQSNAYGSRVLGHATSHDDLF